MKKNDKPLKAVELTNVDEQMQDMVNAAISEDIAHCLHQEGNELNTSPEDNATDNKGISQPAKEQVFNMDDLISLLDKLWPIAEKRIKGIKQANQSPSEDIKIRKNVAWEKT